MLKRLALCANYKIMKNAYYSFIAPYIDYSLLNWGSATNQSLQSLKKVLDKAILLMGQIPEKSILNFDQMYELSVGKFIWQLHNSQLPSCISSLFTKRPVYNISTRSSTPYILINPKTAYLRRSVFFNGLKIWHKIPDLIKKSKSLQNFKKKFKMHLLENFE